MKTRTEKPARHPSKACTQQDRSTSTRHRRRSAGQQRKTGRTEENAEKATTNQKRHRHQADKPAKPNRTGPTKARRDDTRGEAKGGGRRGPEAHLKQPRRQHHSTLRISDAEPESSRHGPTQTGKRRPGMAVPSEADRSKQVRHRILHDGKELQERDHTACHRRKRHDEGPTRNPSSKMEVYRLMAFPATSVLRTSTRFVKRLPY